MSLTNQGLLLLWYGVGGMRVIMKFLRHMPKALSCVMWMGVMVCSALLLSAVGNRAQLGSNAVSSLNFLILPIMLVYTALYSIPPKARLAIMLTNIALSFVFIQLYHSGFRHWAEDAYGEYTSTAVTLGYSNPNQTALFLLSCFIGLVVGVFYFKTQTVKCLLCIDALYIAWILYGTESRTTFLAVLLFLGMIVAKRLWGWSKKWTNVAVLIPLGYAVLALFFIAYFGGVELWGESFFNGREDIYQQYLDNLSVVNFIFGDFNEFKFSNLHNGYVSVAATAGVFTVWFFIKLIKKSMDSNFETAMSGGYSSVAFFGMLCIILCSSTEAAYFVGGSTYAFLVFTIFAMFAHPYAKEES